MKLTDYIVDLSTITEKTRLSLLDSSITIIKDSLLYTTTRLSIIKKRTLVYSHEDKYWYVEPESIETDISLEDFLLKLYPLKYNFKL